MFNPTDIFAELEKAAEEMAEAVAQSDYLDDYGKHLIAVWKQESNHKSDAAAETSARAKPEWAEFLEGRKSAHKKALRLKARYDNLRSLSELRRTAEASQRYLTR